MAAPTITWRQCTGSAGAVTYTSILSLDFGTVTAGAYSNWKVVRPKVTVNSIQSCKWWLSDTAAVRSAAAASIGTANGWYHGFTLNASAPAVCSATKASAGLNGTESPQTSGSAASYAAVAPNSYGRFIGLCLKVASAAGDGATTAKRLIQATRRVIFCVNLAKFGERFKMLIPSEALSYLRERVETRWQGTLSKIKAQGIVQSTNLLRAVKTVVESWGYQLDWAIHKVICAMNFVKLGELFKMTIPNQGSQEQGRESKRRITIFSMVKDVLQTTNMQFAW